jgi:hypothetical protein
MFQRLAESTVQRDDRPCPIDHQAVAQAPHRLDTVEEFSCLELRPDPCSVHLLRIILQERFLAPDCKQELFALAHPTQYLLGRQWVRQTRQWMSRRSPLEADPRVRPLRSADASSCREATRSITSIVKPSIDDFPKAACTNRDPVDVPQSTVSNPPCLLRTTLRSLRVRVQAPEGVDGDSMCL